MSRIKDLFEVAVIVTRKKSYVLELTRGILLTWGFGLEQIGEFSDDRKMRLCVYFSTASSAQALKRKLEKLPLQNCKIIIRRITRADWVDSWQRQILPFTLTNDIMVVPIWHKKSSFHTNKKIIYLDPELAFGTGLHETTRFMAELIEGLNKQFKSFLDVGTGSGILSICAKYYGADDICAIDLDPHCIKVARNNFRLNKCSGKLFCLAVQDFKTTKTYDVVAANLTTIDLMACKKRLVRQVPQGGYLALSGISVTSLSRIRRSFYGMSLRCCKILKGRKWAAVLFRKH